MKGNQAQPNNEHPTTNNEHPTREIRFCITTWFLLWNQVGLIKTADLEICRFSYNALALRMVCTSFTETEWHDEYFLHTLMDNTGVKFYPVAEIWVTNHDKLISTCRRRTPLFWLAISIRQFIMISVRCSLAHQRGQVEGAGLSYLGEREKHAKCLDSRHTLFGTYVSGRIIFAAGDTLICGTQGPEVCMNAVCPSDLETGNGVPQNRTSTCGFWWTAYSFQGVMVRFNAVPLLAPLSFVADWAQNTIQLINIFPCLAIQSPQTQTVQVKMTSAVHLNLPSLVFF